MVDSEFCFFFFFFFIGVNLKSGLPQHLEIRQILEFQGIKMSEKSGKTPIRINTSGKNKALREKMLASLKMEVVIID